MKNKILTLILFCLIYNLGFSQSPAAIPYQAIVRDSSGSVMATRPVQLRFTIHDGSFDGAVVYNETHQTISNMQGLVNVQIGLGTAVTGTLSAINWGAGSKFLQAEMKINNSNAYVNLGTQQLMSVPYALYANSSKIADSSKNGMPAGNTNGEILYWSNGQWIKINPGSYGQSLIMCDGVPSWGGCLPKLTGAAVSNVSYTSAVSGGNISSDGGSSIIAKGICWGLTSNPSVALATKTNEGQGVGSFSSTISSLTQNSTYHVRAYATNSIGTVYGNDITFTTMATTLASITAATVTNISATSAICGGTITGDGGSNISARGVCWSTSPNPTIALTTKTNDGTGTGAFTSSITDLNPLTTYYVRAYATNGVGTVYGAQQVFTTTNVASIPNVTIGSQVWSTKNLDVVTYRNGDPIPQVTDPTTWANLTTGAWCWYNNDSTNGAVYGKLYNWYAVNDPRGLAPNGWHIPTDGEWNTMTKFLDASVDTTCQCWSGSTIGTQLKNSTGWINSGNGTNSSGFAGLPGGYRYFDGFFYDIGYYGVWWSSSEDYTTNAWYRPLSYLYASVSRDDYGKSNGFSVRLVRD